MKKAVWIPLLLAFCLTLSGCGARQNTATEGTFWQMDSAVTVRLYGEKTACEEALQRAGTLLAEKDALLSATLADSPVARLNAAPAGEVFLPAELVSLLAQAFVLEEQTGGAFTVTVEPLLCYWQRAETAGKTDEAELAAALGLIGASHWMLTETGAVKDGDKVAVQLGGIGKGYALDAVKEMLLSTAGVTGGIVSCTSSVVVFGVKPDASAFTVAIRNPADRTDTLPFRLQLDEGTALSVSGDYERYFTVDGVNFSHILNPATGYPPENGLHSVAVLAESAAVADALSTALMVMGEEKGRALWESGETKFEALFVYENSYSATAGFAARMTESTE